MMQQNARGSCNDVCKISSTLCEKGDFLSADEEYICCCASCQNWLFSPDEIKSDLMKGPKITWIQKKERMKNGKKWHVGSGNWSLVCREKLQREWASKETGYWQIILMTARFLLHFAKKEIFRRKMRIYLLLCSMPELALFPRRDKKWFDERT